MTTVYDVPAKELIDEIAKKIAKDKIFIIPEGNIFSKTSVDREHPPTNADWWHVRCGSILRKIYMNNGIGIEHLRMEYGGKRNRGSKPYKARLGSGSIVRRAVQQLEKAGYVKSIKGKGRVITPKGQSFMDNISNEVFKKVKGNYQGLEKY
jgi:small subunit ribosomal protein S19e